MSAFGPRAEDERPLTRSSAIARMRASAELRRSLASSLAAGFDVLRTSAATPARTRCAAPPQAAGKSETLERYAQRLSARPARSAAKHVPGVRVAARRAAHAPHGDGAFGLGLLRLRVDVHVAFLRRAPDRWLRALQLRNARHRKAVRGHPRGGLQARRSRRSTMPMSSSIFVCRQLPACRCNSCRKRSTACASSASTCRASACRRMPRPRMFLPAPCSSMRAREAGKGSRAGAARRRQ